LRKEAASRRATFRLSMPDALIVATGIISQVHHLVTNDAD
jgi:predicted nucleic acid-binding protein